MYLNCHSHYSYRYGTQSEVELLEKASSLGIRTLALTDINYTSGCLNFIRLAPKYHIKPVIGIDFRVDNRCLYIGLAKNNLGFLELNEFLSYHKHHEVTFPNQPPPFQHVAIVIPFEQVVRTNKQHFAPHEYIGLRPEDILRFGFSKWKHLLHHCVMLATWSFNSKIEFNTHRLLRAMDLNTLLSKLPAEEQGLETHQLILPEKLKEMYADCPSVVRNTEALLEECSIEFNFSSNRPSQNIKTYTGCFHADRTLLHSLCYERLSYRYPKPSEEVILRLQKELDLIEQMQFVAFFLVNWDIVQYAYSRDYYHVGRGSGANSIVAYLLGITDVDPIELDLYFERFMNLYRVNPPDFDIDFSTWDRPDMTRYIFNRFGKRKNVSLLAAYSTFQYSAAVRELGKVFGLPKQEIDLLSDGKYDPKKLDHIAQLILRYAKRLDDKPNYLTVHAAGILISEKPVHYYSATDLPPKGYPLSHFDMHVAEDIGLHKFDILGQRGLGKIKDTLEIIKVNQPNNPPLDVHNPRPLLTDKRVNDMIREAQCIGCFYVESPAMRNLIKKLAVDNYLALVAASSIIRPGVAQSGMMREYILRHKDPERRKQAHPVLWDIMPETYGVMVYQEDVIKVAHHFAGLTLGEADVLRRGMSGKFRSREEFQQVRQQFYSNCATKGYEEKLIDEVWHQIESFAGYAFAKGHSASYAVESYQSLYLKAYYPLEYMVAVLNNGGGYYRPELYIHEARLLGAEIVTCCINEGEWQTTIENKRIRLGFQFILNIEKKIIDQILQERYVNGKFESFHDFLERLPIAKEQIQLLIRIGAMDCFRLEKRKLLWQAMFHAQHEKVVPNQYKLFREKRPEFILPELPVDDVETAFDQLELFGFFLLDPFRLGKDILEKPTTLAHAMLNHINKPFSIVGYLIAIKNTRTHKGEGMQFGTFIDRAGQWLDTVHFPPVARVYTFTGRGLYYLQGIVRDDFGALSLEIQRMEKIPFITDPRYT
jgi:DNA-directed DNA polymerase III PolC